MSGGEYGEGGLPPDINVRTYISTQSQECMDQEQIGEIIPNPLLKTHSRNDVSKTHNTGVLSNLIQSLGGQKTVGINNNEQVCSTEQQKHYDLKTRYRPSDKGPFFVYIESLDKNIGKLHAIRVGHHLKQDSYLRSSIVDIKTLGKNKIKVEFKNHKSANDILTHRCIKENNYVAYIPKFYVERRGIVKGVDTYFNEEYLLNEIKLENPDAVNVKRFTRKIMQTDGTEKVVPRQLISVSFLGTSLPKRIVINQVIFEVEPYIYPVIICNKCLRYGHVIQNCKGKSRCKNCGETHDESFNCTSIKCIYCNSNEHTSSSKDCPEYKNQRKYKENMAKFNISFKEATQMNKFPDYSKILTQNKFEILDEEKDFPSLPSTSTHIFTAKPKNVMPRRNFISTSQPLKFKKRKMDEPSQKDYNKSGNTSILPNPYRDEFISYKEKLIESMAVYIDDLVKKISNTDILNVTDLHKNIKDSVTSLINNVTNPYSDTNGAE